MATLGKTAPSLTFSAGTLLGSLWQVATVWAERRRSRQSLARLDAHLLRDIGLAAREADSEAARPFWLD